MLLTLEDYKTYFNIEANGNDGHISAIIPYAESLVDLYLGRTVEEATYIDEVYDGGLTILYLNNYPITTLTSVTDDGTLLVLDTDYVAYLEEGYIDKDINIYTSLLNTLPTFTNKKQCVVITYTAGYTATTLPTDLKLAYLLIIKSLIDQQKKPATGIIRQSLHGEDRQFAKPTKADIRLLPQEATELLASYRA